MYFLAMYWAWYVKLYYAWSSFLQSWDRRIINTIYLLLLLRITRTCMRLRYDDDEEEGGG